MKVSRETTNGKLGKYLQMENILFHVKQSKTIIYETSMKNLLQTIK